MSITDAALQVVQVINAIEDIELTLCYFDKVGGEEFPDCVGMDAVVDLFR